MSAVERTERTPQIDDSALVNAVVDPERGCGVGRYFTIPGRDPFDEIEWELRDAYIPGKDGPVFEQKGVEFPKFWSQTATNIVAQKYFRGRMGSPEREWSVKQMIDRIVETIPGWGVEGGYFADADEADTFQDELQGDSSSTSSPPSTPRSGSTSASRRSRNARRASSSRSTTRWSRSSTGSAGRASSSAGAPAPA